MKRQNFLGSKEVGEGVSDVDVVVGEGWEAGKVGDAEALGFGDAGLSSGIVAIVRFS